MFRIVIIDDNLAGADAMACSLPWESIGCQVAGVAYDGREGLEMILRERPDLFITDIRMPGMDGLTMLEEVRKQMPDCRCIFISAYDQFAYAQKALRLEACDYLLKPFMDEELLETVQKALEGLEDHASSGNAMVDAIMKYIRENLSSALTLNDLSERFGLVPSYISSLISRYTGRTFSDYLREERLRLARTLLDDPTIHVDEVARRLGYKNYITFYKMFQRFEGMSPTAYRNRKGQP